VPVVEPLIENDEAKAVPLPPPPDATASFAARSVLAPAAATLGALAVHELLVNGQAEAIPSGLYPRVLQSVLVAVAVLAVAQSFSKPLRIWAGYYGPLLAGAIGWLAVWDLCTLKLALVQLPYFPGPERVLDGMVDDGHILLVSAAHSFARLVAGYVGGLLIGLFCGVLIGWFRLCRYWGMPFVKLLGPIPATAYIPLVMTLSTSPFWASSGLIALTVWFPVTMLTISGIANVPNSYFDVARTLGAGRLYLIFRVAIPAALPTIFIGVFMGLGASFLTLATAETVGVPNGLGWYMSFQQGWAEYYKMYAALIIMSVFFSGIMTVLFLLRDWLLSWQKGVIRW
jgi:NitT/TauT family transport system permease protein